jgi:hypothetical protein
MTIRTERCHPHPEQIIYQDKKQMLNGQGFYVLYLMDQHKSIGQDGRNRSKFNKETGLRGGTS